MTTPYGAIDELFAECERPMHHIEVSGPALRDPLERMGVIPAKKVLTALRDARKLIADLTGEHDEMCATRREDSGHGPCDCGKDSYDLAIDAVLCVLDGGRSPFDPVIRERYETAAAVERGVRETPDTEQLLRFAGQALSECHIEFVGDWDGGSLQEAMLDCGLLEQIERAVPCGGECACSEAVKAGETTRCCVTTPLGDRAWAAYNDARKQIGRATRSGRRPSESVLPPGSAG